MMTFKEINEKLQQFTVGIAGAGGLGSNCAVALARCGIGKLVIVDFDTVDKTNLNRQYYFEDQIDISKVKALKENIARINPKCECEIHETKVTKENIIPLFSEADVIVEAFDLAEMKSMLIETVLSKLENTPIVSGLGMAGWGDNNSIHSRNIENLYICGDEASEISETMPPLAPRVGIVANMQANTVLEILLKQ